tara:strand:- start:2139 stop:2741 length:603 start_codon:yes stop_codon:yes gene_type:complete
MAFKNQKFEVVKKIVSKEMCNFFVNYFTIKKRVFQTLLETKQISPLSTEYGVWNDPQSDNTYCCYADIAMETLLLKFKPVVEKITNMELIENHSYTRIYKKGDVLEKHVDRKGCEISTTLNLGGDKKWSIYLEPDIKINLNPGDMLIYSGCELEHWRNAFEGEECFQSFFHYNDIKRKDHIKFDNRPHVGLPLYTKKNGN